MALAGVEALTQERSRMQGPLAEGLTGGRSEGKDRPRMAPSLWACGSQCTVGGSIIPHPSTEIGTPEGKQGAEGVSRGFCLAVLT